MFLAKAASLLLDILFPAVVNSCSDVVEMSVCLLVNISTRANIKAS